MERRHTTLWRSAALLVAIAATVLAMALAAPTRAHALAQPNVCAFASQAPTFKGWAQLSFRGCLQPGQGTTMECRGLDAYRWTGAAWQAVDLNECTYSGVPVYAWPYATGWTWIWTQQTGWLATQSKHVLVYQGGTLRDSVHGH